MFGTFANSEINGNSSLVSASEKSSNCLQTLNIDQIKDNVCDDCSDNDCHDRDEHCAHHCTGIHHMALFEKPSLKVSASLNSLDKRNWYFLNKYSSPFIDPALKPPTFS